MQNIDKRFQMLKKKKKWFESESPMYGHFDLTYLTFYCKQITTKKITVFPVQKMDISG